MKDHHNRYKSIIVEMLVTDVDHAKPTHSRTSFSQARMWDVGQPHFHDFEIHMRNKIQI